MKKVIIMFLAMLLAVGLTLPMASVAAATESLPQTQTLWAGQDIDVGTVSVWNDNTNLYVKYETTGGWEMTETHLAIGNNVGDIPQTKKGNPIPGHFMYSTEHDPAVTEYEVVISGFAAGGGLFIAAHAVVVRPLEDCWETIWQIGDVEVVNGDTGWLENYADEFNWEDPAGPTTMGPGLAVSAPPFTDPFIVGTTPTAEFPYNSNKVRDYATDFDVQWDDSLPFGGKLTISWSPGQSANETKVVGDGITTTSFSATGTPSPGAGWFMDKYPLVEHSVSINPLPDGVHVINFQHTQGDGTFWDWVRLEKPCEQEETAWAEGTRFVTKGNWATYFTYEVIWDLLGDWELSYIQLSPTPGPYIHNMSITIENFSDGSFSGTGNWPAGIWTWIVTGTVSGDSVSMTITYDQAVGGTDPYIVSLIGTVAAGGNSMIGTASDNKGNDYTWTATRVP